MTNRKRFKEITSFLVFVLTGLIVPYSGAGRLGHNVTTQGEGQTGCKGENCSSAILNTTTPEVTQFDTCSGHSDGWGLRGSDWGCCGNYDGCCTYASLICYFHDAMCRCCDVGNNFCGPTCKPEAGCNGVENDLRSERNLTGNDRKIERNLTVSQENIDKDKSHLQDVTDNEGKIANIKESVKHSDINVTLNDTFRDELTKSESYEDYLDIEEIEIVMNDTYDYDDFDQEFDKLFNETEAFLNENDGHLDEPEDLIIDSFERDDIYRDHNDDQEDNNDDDDDDYYDDEDGNEDDVGQIDVASPADYLAVDDTKLFKGFQANFSDQSKTSNETVQAVSAIVPDINDEYLDIEAVEMVINTTEGYVGDFQFELEIESFLNDTDLIFDGFDESWWGENGSGDLDI